MDDCFFDNDVQINGTIMTIILLFNWCSLDLSRLIERLKLGYDDRRDVKDFVGVAKTLSLLASNERTAPRFKIKILEADVPKIISETINENMNMEEKHLVGLISAISIFLKCKVTLSTMLSLSS